MTIRLSMMPAPGEHLLRFVGDRLRVQLRIAAEQTTGWSAFLRTNLTRAKQARAEVVAQAGLRTEDALTFAGASWRDIPLVPCEGGFCIDLPLLEVGHFRAKAYCSDAQGRQYWPEGGDLGVSVHPDRLRTANIIYCVFPRSLGGEGQASPPGLSSAVEYLDERGWTVIPPSGTLRSLRRHLPHIFEKLGCRILHLLPIGPVPTTYARMGRYGSPYAQLDLTGIDPAMVELDRRTTAEDQFRELADAVHLHGGQLMLDVVLNHTGWGARLMEEHPEWFKRNPDGTFHSPGAWGVTWEDLVELDQRDPALWDLLSEALITWCARGVDGFRCDAGYMIPLAAWQYIVARVRQRFPECLFLLEGLGGAWEATASLLTVGGMQWAYSELFQCYDPRHVAEYLDHVHRQSPRIGPLAHYSETHDNDRLAKRGAAWSSMRNHLCALSSHCGAFGFSAGVEWLCTEKVDVHEARSLGWGQSPNLIETLSRLHRLLQQHPCFFDGAQVERVSALDSPVLALARSSRDGSDHCLVLVNLDCEQPQTVTLPRAIWARGGDKRVDLLGATLPAVERGDDGVVELALAPGQGLCLAPHSAPIGLSGDAYRMRRAQAAWALTQLGEVIPHELLGACDFEALGVLAASDAEAFLASLRKVDPAQASRDLLAALEAARRGGGYPCVVTLRAQDENRITLVPPDHWLLVRDTHPFQAALALPSGQVTLRSTAMASDHVAAFAPQADPIEADLVLRLERFGDPGQRIALNLRQLAPRPALSVVHRQGLVLLTNGRGAMARIQADLGSVRSKYDCLLGANLSPVVPEDRHVFAKRLRAWVNADGFITALDGDNLVGLSAGQPAVWSFAANAGDGRRVGIRLEIALLEAKNTLVIRCARTRTGAPDLPDDRNVRVTLRLDLEDRNFHHETHADPGLAQHFANVTSSRPDAKGFVFAPAPGRRLEAYVLQGAYYPQPEWCYGLPHPIDAERGMAAAGDAFSPGWFDLPLAVGQSATVVVSAEADAAASELAAEVAAPPQEQPGDTLEQRLRRAAEQFVVKRDDGKTVIAGYPWFLDWGRDTFIAARGLIAGGWHDDVRALLRVYGRFEREGTLPNFLRGDMEGSRETSDAPLWYALACEELARHVADGLYALRVNGERRLADVLLSIAVHMRRGTPHGVRVDPDSGLVWSPAHYTWMDTNYPAATPRQGYPIELSVLWIRLLRQLARLGIRAEGFSPGQLAAQAETSLELFFRPELGFFSDTLHAEPGVPAAAAVADDHLRPNQLLAISLGLVTDARARSAVAASTRWLLIPGAMRTLAPRSVSHLLPVLGPDGRPLHDPARPYWGHYTGDEDTRRKPAYHNGTGWVWWLPTYCEAVVACHDRDPAALAAARAVLGSVGRLLDEGCLGQLPEIVDGDLPHAQRGCDAQAWSVTEALRVWLTLK